MEKASFIFTIFFMLLGPIKLIPLFGGLTTGADSQFKRAVAIRSIVIVAVLCAFVLFAGGWLVTRYEISLAALRIGAGLVLLIAALLVIFQATKPPAAGPGTSSAMQLAVSPLAVPGIVPPAGIAAILICAMLAQSSPGMMQAVAICLAIVIVLDFLVMWFIDRVLKTPGLGIVLTVLGSALIFLQVGLAIDAILNGIRDSGLAQAQ